jgi:hypothetical protein
VSRVASWLLLAVLFAAGSAEAQQTTLPYEQAIDGIPAGPFFLKPLLGVGVSGETNPLYAPDSANPDGDVVSRAALEFDAILPFKNSYARAGYNGVFRRFASDQIPNLKSRDVIAELSLKFSTRDRLVVHGIRTTGASETIPFDGSEQTPDGTPYQYGVYTLGADRYVPGRFGYEVAVVWSDLAFDQSNTTFQNFTGWDTTLDVHAPISPTLWIVGGVATRRYDNFYSSTGELFRKEYSNAVRGGVKGILGTGRFYHVILGYERASYPGGAGSDFDGLVGDAAIDLKFGPSTTMTIYGARRRWSSFYGDNNYYIADTIGTQFRHRWAELSEVGVTAALGRSNYADAFDVNSEDQHHRRDNEWGLETYGTLALGRIYGLRVSYLSRVRHTNENSLAYSQRSFGVQLVVGWR